MRTFLAAALVVGLVHAALAQTPYSNPWVHRAPQSHAPVVRAPAIVHAPIVRSPVVRAPAASSQVRSGAAPAAIHIGPSLPITTGMPTQQPRIIQAGPKIIRVPPSTSTPPAVVHRQIARRIAVHGRFLALPAILIVGAPFVLDVPDLGWVSVPEDEYAEIYDLLTSDNPADVELGYRRLQELAGR
jgi:hypothetical protein